MTDVLTLGDHVRDLALQFTGSIAVPGLSLAFPPYEAIGRELSSLTPALPKATTLCAEAFLQHFGAAAYGRRGYFRCAVRERPPYRHPTSQPPALPANWHDRAPAPLNRVRGARWGCWKRRPKI